MEEKISKIIRECFGRLRDAAEENKLDIEDKLQESNDYFEEYILNIFNIEQ
jgi:hypothetical protein